MMGEQITQWSRKKRAYSGLYDAMPLPIADASERPAIPALTGLRFIAAISVVIAHGAATWPAVASLSTITYWLETGGGIGMTMFFVLSGFVIHYNYANLIVTGKLSGVAHFLWLRFARLYPLFLLVLAFDVIAGPELIDFLKGNNFGEPLTALPYYLLFVQSWVYLVGRDHSLTYLIGRDLPLTWSVSTEWFFYVAYPAVMLILIRLKSLRGTFVAALLWCGVWGAAVSSLYDHIPEISAWSVQKYGHLAAVPNDSYWRWLLYFSPYVRIGEFILGCLSAHLYMQLQAIRISSIERKVGSFLTYLAIATIPVVIYLMYAPDVGENFFRKMSLNFGLAPSVAASILGLARYNTIWSRWLSTHPMVALGDASYSIYLLHILIYMAMPENATLMPDNKLDIAYVFMRLGFDLVLICILALGLYHVVETPSRRWLRGHWTRSRTRWQLGLAFAPAIAAGLLLVSTSEIQAYSPFLVSNGVNVTSATYGGNCGGKVGNSTKFVAEICNGRAACSYRVDHSVIGDPAPGCGKSFSIVYQCLPGTHLFHRDVPGGATDADGTSLTLTCAK